MPPADRRQFFHHGELALVVLALLARRPMHGYELMNDLDRRFRPAYQPSPGSVYPALAALVAEGLLKKTEDAGANDRRRTYRLTAAGRDVLDQRRGQLAAFEVRTGSRLSGEDSLDDALARLRVRIEAVARSVDIEHIEACLDAVAGAIEDAARAAGQRSRRGR